MAFTRSKWIVAAITAASVTIGMHYTLERAFRNIDPNSGQLTVHLAQQSRRTPNRYEYSINDDDGIESLIFNSASGSEVCRLEYDPIEFREINCCNHGFLYPLREYWKNDLENLRGISPENFLQISSVRGYDDRATGTFFLQGVTIDASNPLNADRLIIVDRLGNKKNVWLNSFTQ